jgi:hypothetical protein
MRPPDGPPTYRVASAVSLRHAQDQQAPTGERTLAWSFRSPCARLFYQPPQRIQLCPLRLDLARKTSRLPSDGPAEHRIDPESGQPAKSLSTKRSEGNRPKDHRSHPRPATHTRPCPLPGRAFHDLRHTHETWQIEDEVPQVLQHQRLGHKMARISYVTPAMLSPFAPTLLRLSNAAFGGAELFGEFA